MEDVEMTSAELDARIKEISLATVKGELDVWCAKQGVSDPASFAERIKAQGGNEADQRIGSQALGAALWASKQARPQVKTPSADFVLTVLALSNLGRCASKDEAVARFKDLCKRERDGKGWARVESQVTKALQATVFSAGGSLLPEDLSAEFIELLRPLSVVRAMGARTMQVPHGKMDIGRLNSGATSYWTAEGAPITVSQPSTGRLVLDLKKLATLVPVSNDVRRFAPAGVEGLVGDDMLAAHAQAEDQAFIRSNGTLSRPRGIRHLMASANAFATAGTSLQQITDDLSKAQYKVIGSDVRGSQSGWIMNPRSFFHLMSLRDGNGNYVFMDELSRGQLGGHRVGLTNNVPRNLGGGTNETEIYFGMFDELIIGDGASVEYDESNAATYNDGVSNRNSFQTDETLLRLIAHNDMVMRHDKAFSCITGITWGATLDS